MPAGFIKTLRRFYDLGRPRQDWGAARIWHRIEYVALACQMVTIVIMMLMLVLSFFWQTTNLLLSLSLFNMACVGLSLWSQRQKYRADRQQHEVWRSLHGDLEHQMGDMRIDVQTGRREVWIGDRWMVF